MDISFHYLLMAEQAMVQKELLNGLSDTPLSLGQPKVLDYLKEHDGSRQREIATGCFIEPPTLTFLLNRMEESGLIERRTKDNNRRTLYVYLTAAGKAYQERVEEQFREIEENVFVGFTEEEKRCFMDSFYRIYANLKKKRGLE